MPYLFVRPEPDFDYWTQGLPAVLVFGIGLTLTVAPLTSTILGAINNAVSRVAGLVLVATIGIIVGGQLDLDGFQRATIVAAALLIAGGVVSFFGIRADPAESGGAFAPPPRSQRRGPSRPAGHDTE